MTCVDQLTDLRKLSRVWLDNEKDSAYTESCGLFL